MKKKNKNTQLVWYLFLLPSFLGLALFMAYPVMESFRLSFFRSNGTIEKWAGIDNYIYVFKNAGFWQAVRNTFYIGFFQLLISIPLGFIIASIINQMKWFKNFFKVIFFIPYVTSIVAAAMVFLYVLHPDMGLLNTLLSSLGLPTSTWLADSTTARWGVIILSVWHQLGFIIIISLANLQAIPNDIYESSSIDGANRFKQWWFITIPNMTGTFAFFVVMGWIGALKRFSETYILGGLQGSPGRSLYTIVGFIYERGFGGNEFGVASAAAYILFAIILIFTIFNLKISKMNKAN
ncbi:carbohydrate ABC transporter permease [Vallitalea guaymasensis]|nr:sugar ABC transporter permease [Vallitalea guaymasensis]